MQTVALRQLPPKTTVRGGCWIGNAGPSAGWAGALADILGEREDERRLKATRLEDLNETARQQALALAAMMDDSEPTPFSLEAGAIYILRSQRCLAGMPWRVAAFESRAIVKIALNKCHACGRHGKTGSRCLCTLSFARDATRPSHRLAGWAGRRISFAAGLVDLRRFTTSIFTGHLCSVLPPERT